MEQPCPLPSVKPLKKDRYDDKSVQNLACGFWRKASHGEIYFIAFSKGRKKKLWIGILIRLRRYIAEWTAGSTAPCPQPARRTNKNGLLTMPRNMDLQICEYSVTAATTARKQTVPHIKNCLRPSVQIKSAMWLSLIFHGWIVTLIINAAYYWRWNTWRRTALYSWAARRLDFFRVQRIPDREKAEIILILYKQKVIFHYIK